MSIDPKKLEEQVVRLNDIAIVADGLEDAMIGIVLNREGVPVIAYSIPKIIDIFMKNDGMTYEEAEEHFEFNVESAYFGEGTPVYLDVIEIVPLEQLQNKS